MSFAITNRRRCANCAHKRRRTCDVQDQVLSAVYGLLEAQRRAGQYRIRTQGHCALVSLRACGCNHPAVHLGRTANT